MKRIWKYTLTPICELDIPKGAKVLSVEVQHGKPRIWILVDTDAEMESRTFCSYGTGHDIPDDPGAYIGTLQLKEGTLVFHVFEEL